MYSRRGGWWGRRERFRTVRGPAVQGYETPSHADGSVATRRAAKARVGPPPARACERQLRLAASTITQAGEDSGKRRDGRTRSANAGDEVRAATRRRSGRRSCEAVCERTRASNGTRAHGTAERSEKRLAAVATPELAALRRGSARRTISNWGDHDEPRPESASPTPSRREGHGDAARSTSARGHELRGRRAGARSL